ncbi:MAG: hypothetical protein GXX84_08395, partial [Acidobacteria bacterium]|nr:hypothetical protein [Acidobacteriota bacterium]
SAFGIGTALPVVVLALVIAFGVKSLGKFFDRLTQLEKWVRKATAFIFIAAGLYLLLQSILGFPGF